MTQGQVLDIARTAIYNIIILSLPTLLISMIIGLTVSIFQTVTSIQEQTLTFVPKFIGVFAGLMIMGPWILGTLASVLEDMCNSFSLYI